MFSKKLLYTALLSSTLLLAACAGGAPAAPTSNVVSSSPQAAASTSTPAPATNTATVAPTDGAPAASPQPSATIAATSSSATNAASLLPAPLYILDAGQIFRIEGDGSDRVQLTNEQSVPADARAVIEFAIAPTDGALAYTVQRNDRRLLVVAGPRGEEPRTLFEQAASIVSAPVWAPDGNDLVFHIHVPSEQPAALAPGLYRIARTGGAAQLLLADDVGRSGDEAFSYSHASISFSPNGKRLLLFRYAQQVEMCDLALAALDGSPPVVVQVPPTNDPTTRRLSCTPATWSADSTAVYFTLQNAGSPTGGLGLYKADATTGAVALIVPEQGEGGYNLFAAPHFVGDKLVALLARSAKVPQSFGDEQPPLDYGLVAVDPATGAISDLRALGSFFVGRTLWAPAGTGLIVEAFGPSGDPPLIIWQPIEGSEATLSGGSYDIGGFAWGK